MNSSENMDRENFEKLEAYLNDEMSAEQRRLLEDELKSDPDLRQELEFLRESQLAIKAGAMKKRMEDWHQNLEDRKTHSNKFPWIALAASFLIIFGVLGWLWFPDSSERLFVEKVRLDPGLPTPMSAESESYEFYDAMVDYKNEEYRLAWHKWRQQLSEQPNNDTLIYYCGATHFALGEYEFATDYYQQILELDDSPFKGKSEWYLSLSWLKMGEEEKIHQLARRSQSEYAPRIRELSEEIHAL